MNSPTDPSSSTCQSPAESFVWTTMSILKWSNEFLRSKGFSTPRLDAELLLSNVLNCSRVQLYTQFDKPLSDDERARFKIALRRRVGGEPIAYITGQREFYGRKFVVGPEVLIPRPDTELLVDVAIEEVQSSGNEHAKLIDLCTGSGCIAISLALELSNAELTAIDCSTEALSIAMRNAEYWRVADRINFQALDLTQVKFNYGDRFDLVISNPPYISTSAIETLDVGVRSYEPRLALDGGSDGIDFYRHILRHLPDLLRPNGFIVVEIGYDQGEAVASLFANAGLGEVRIRQDLSGADRVVTGRWQ